MSFRRGRDSGPRAAFVDALAAASAADSRSPTFAMVLPAAPFATPDAPNVRYVSGSPATSNAKRVGPRRYHGSFPVACRMIGTSDNPMVRTCSFCR